MSNHQQTMADLKAYKRLELNHKKNLQFFLEKHSTKEGTWGNLTVHEGTVEFAFLDGNDNELACHSLNQQVPSLLIPPASWHKIKSTSSEFNASLQFFCQPYRYFEKKYRLAPIHPDLWNIYQTYLREWKKISILDVGCCFDQSLLFFALSGHDIFGVDSDEDVIENIRHIAKQEQLSNINTFVHDLNQSLPIQETSFDFIYSTTALRYLNPSNIEQLLTKMQSLTSTGGLHFLIFPIKAQPYTYPENFTFLAEKNELYHFYQDRGWSILEYKEKPGQLDENNELKQGLFGQLLAQKHL